MEEDEYLEVGDNSNDNYKDSIGEYPDCFTKMTDWERDLITENCKVREGATHYYLDKWYDKYFTKVDETEMIREGWRFITGKGDLQPVLKNFFRELIMVSQTASSRMSPMASLLDDVCVDEMLEFTKKYPVFYPKEYTQFNRVNVYFGNAGKVASRVANFEPETAREIFTYHFQDENGFCTRDDLVCLDTSCGFGARMSGVLLNDPSYHFTYLGIDPNTKLQERLNEMGEFYKKHKLTNGTYDLRCQGSEVFIPEWVGKADVMFTSPPYFDLEVYSNEETQSLSYGSYHNWVKYFVQPTVINIYKYLKPGGIAMINIKNMTKSKPAFDDFVRAFMRIKGFERMPDYKYSPKRRKSFEKTLNYSEPIMVFKKVGVKQENSSKEETK